MISPNFGQLKLYGDYPALLVRFPFPDERVSGQASEGWLPSSVVEISLSAFYGQVTRIYSEKVRALVADIVNIPSEIQDSDCRLVRIFATFLAAFGTESRSGDLLRSKYINHVNQMGHVTVARQIAQGVRKISARLLDVLSRDDFTVEDVITAAGQVRGSSHGNSPRKVLYLLVYRAQDAEDPELGLYVGKTDNEHARLLAHRRGHNDVSQLPDKHHRYHYKRSSKSFRQADMYILAEISDDIMQALGEQTLICLFDCYASWITRFAKEEAETQQTLQVTSTQRPEEAAFSIDVANGGQLPEGTDADEGRVDYRTTGAFILKVCSSLSFRVFGV